MGGGGSRGGETEVNKPAPRREEGGGGACTLRLVHWRPAHSARTYLSILEELGLAHFEKTGALGARAELHCAGKRRWDAEGPRHVEFLQKV